MISETQHVEGAIAQAFIDPANPDYGYVRFEAGGTVVQYRLARLFFDQFGRDIGSAAKKAGLQTRAPFQANNPTQSGKDS